MAYIMVVDDDEDMASAVVAMLQNDGHEALAEHDTDRAVASMEERRPDLVILDVMFSSGKTAGFTLARAIRHHNEKLRGIPVLILTAVHQEHPELDFRDRDIDDYWLPVAGYLRKPIAPSVLRQKVSESLFEKNMSADGVGKEASD